MKQIIFIACILLLLSCNQRKVENKPEGETKSGRTDTALIMASIDSLAGVVQKAHDTRDNKLMATTWAKDGILVVAGNPPIRGRDAVVAALSKMPPPPPGGKMEIHPMEVHVLGPEWAYVLGVDSLKYTKVGATGQTVETSTFFVLVRKTPEGWQTFREILTPNQPQAKQ